MRKIAIIEYIEDTCVSTHIKNVVATSSGVIEKRKNNDDFKISSFQKDLLIDNNFEKPKSKFHK